ncbi:MAG: hypothetical protein Q9188_004747 [Gyalolechia gomerana]
MPGEKRKQDGSSDKQPEKHEGKFQILQVPGVFTDQRRPAQARGRSPSSVSSADTEELMFSGQPMPIRQVPAPTYQSDQDRAPLAARVTTILNDFDDLELQRLLVRRFWEVTNHPSLDQLRDMAVNILRLAGPRLAPRDGIILLLQAGLNPALAVRQYTRSRNPRLERDVQNAVRPPPAGRETQDKLKRSQDYDDDLPLPKEVESFMAEDPDNPRAQNYKRARGNIFEDQTAPHPDQLDWRFDERDHFPDILLQWKKADREDPTDPVGDMYWRRHLVVDLDKRNILDFPHIPSALAHNIEPGCLEALERLDGRVKHQDLAARQYDPKAKADPSAKDFKNRDNVLSQRMRRFREKHACVSWGSRRCGGEHFPSYIEFLLPAELKARNTTRGFRDLTDREVLELKSKNLGKFASRSTAKDPDKTKAYLEHEKNRLKRYQEIEARKNTQTETPKAKTKKAVKPSSEDNEYHEDDDDDETEEEQTDIVRKPDARHMRPADKDEEEELHDAMLPTIEHYIELTGNLPIITDWARSYLEIHWDIHRQLRRALRIPDEEDFSLIGLRRWDGGIRGWRSAELSLTFREEWAAEMKY